MALVTRNAGDTVRSLDVDQYLQALTGLMPDQQITIGQLLRVLGRNLRVGALVAPTLSYNIQGAAGSSSITYQLVASNDDGDSVPNQLSVVNAPAALTTSNSVFLQWTLDQPTDAGFGAKTFKVIRSAGGPSQGLIATINFVPGQTTYTYNDQGALGTTYTAVTMPLNGVLTAPIHATTGHGIGGITTARFIGLVPIGGPTAGTWAVGDNGVDAKGNAWMCTVAGTPGTWVPVGNAKLAETVLGSSAASVTFSSIPQGYRHLMLMVTARGDTGGVIQSLLAAFNGDTTNANYNNGTIYPASASSVSYVESIGGGGTFADVTANTAPASEFSHILAHITNYSSTVVNKAIVAYYAMTDAYSSGGTQTRLRFAGWKNTAAINSIQLTPGAGNFVTGSTFTLYGVA